MLAAPFLLRHTYPILKSCRLKSLGGNKTVEALLGLGCSRRILLSGTPVQNNLDEFYALLSIVAPGVLGNPGVFKRVYSNPITKGRDKGANPQERRLGEDRARCGGGGGGAR